MTIGEAGDKYEQEADAVAAQVVDKINSPISQESVQPQLESGTTSVPNITVMRHSESGTGEGKSVTLDVEAGIQRARGGGQGLDESVKEPMEKAFGADFSGVKVHTDAQSDKLNQSIQAKAFTTGQDIFFKQGEYNPGSKGGQELLAHELTHVVQQTGTVQAKVNFEEVRGNNEELIALQTSLKTPQSEHSKQVPLPPPPPMVLFGPVGLGITIVGGLAIIVYYNREEIGRVLNVIAKGITQTLEEIRDLFGDFLIDPPINDMRDFLEREIFGGKKRKKRKEPQYPQDCKASTLIKFAEACGMEVEAGGSHWIVKKDGHTVTTIPHSVKPNDTCRGIIKKLIESCGEEE